MKRLESLWYRVTLWHTFLFPVSVIFLLIISIRRFLYRRGWIRSVKLPVPVIVVGNITVGGSGKTPTAIWLANTLKAHGYHPGIISRGYGGTQKSVSEVERASLATEVGDEPLLMKCRTDVPIFVSSNRPLAAQSLLKKYKHINVIISDDGMQHYQLKRDLELAVIDGQRGFGNGLLLPAGPLREPVSRLEKVDAVIVNGNALAKEIPVNATSMQLTGDYLYQLSHPAERKAIVEFARQRVHAIAGIGNPKRFFDYLRTFNLIVVEHSFPDHYVFQAKDILLEGNEPILMTEKDAVKCQGFANERCWVVPVNAEFPPNFEQYILTLLGRVHGSQTA